MRAQNGREIGWLLQILIIGKLTWENDEVALKTYRKKYGPKNKLKNSGPIGPKSVKVV